MVVGSVVIGIEEFFFIIEEYLFWIGIWICLSNFDFCCVCFGLNEYYNGVIYKVGDKEYLLCVVILSLGMRGILVYDFELYIWF